MSPTAAYVHVPFCRHRCGYCNFTLLAGRDDLMDAYLDALAVELSWLQTPRKVDSRFVGGGTPTHLTPRHLFRLFELLEEWFPLNEGAEFSVEANPSDIDAAKLQALRDGGVNRLSLGAQSFNKRKLAQLERDHDATTIRRAVETARDYVRSVSLDLIFAVPGETVDDWADDLQSAIRLPTDHVSTYGLTIERGTRFWSRRHHGQLQGVDEEIERSMYLLAIERLRAAGFEHYEVSNFARPNQRCRHNQVYWSGREYFAVGPGAARFIGGRREVNHRSTTTYIRRLLRGESPIAESETVSRIEAGRERLVFGMRLLEGVDLDSIMRHADVTWEELAGDEIDRFVDLGLFERVGDRLRLTPEGLLVSDSIWPHFLEP